MTIGAKYIGAVCKPNGKIYCIPFNSDTIMIIDSNTNTVSTLYTINTSNYPTIGSNNEKWCSGVLYNDFIYCAPYSAQAVLIINTVNDTIDVTSISGINLTNYASVLNTRNTEKFFSIVLGLNGLIYCLPSSADTVMIINPNINIIDMSTLSFTRFGLPVGSSNRFRFFGACLGPDGNIYASPWNYDRMIKIDTRTSSLSSVTIPSLVSGTNAFYGTICGSDGKIYGVPFSSSYVLIYDVTNGNVDTTSISGITGSTKYTGAVLSRNDNIYFIPRHASQIMYIKIGLPNQTSWVYSCIFNKL